MNTIIFDSSLKETIITKGLKKEINDEGNIIDTQTQEEVLSPEGTPIHFQDLGIFENGSEIFIKDDIVSLMDYLNNPNI